MKSMTGYGRAVQEEEMLRIEVEIKSVNGRFLKISSKLPQELSPYEQEINRFIGESISRGTISLTVYYNNEQSFSNCYRIEEGRLLHYYRTLNEICEKRFSQSLLPDLAGLINLLHLPGVLQESPIEPLEPQKWAVIRQVFLEAIRQMNQMREEEGRHLLRDIQRQCDLLSSNIERIESIAPQTAMDYKIRLGQKMAEMADRENFSFVQADLLREIAIFSEKVDIHEEVIRLKSHLEQLRQLIFLNEPTGKTLEFILQEMAREANTITAKANNAECSQKVVEMKSLIEKIREQIQNVE